MCAGMLSHQLKQHIIDGEKTIIQNPTDQQKWVHSESAFCLCLTSGWFCHSAFVERTMRKLSLRCMRYMQWMCLSAPERGRWEEVQKHFFSTSFWKFHKGKEFIRFYFSTQAKDGGQRTTVYKRDPNKVYGLKMKTSRTFFSEMERRFDTMPFTLR